MLIRYIMVIFLWLAPSLSWGCEVCKLEEFFRHYEKDFIVGSPNFVSKYFASGATENGKPITEVYQTFFTDTQDRELKVIADRPDREGWMRAKTHVSATLKGKRQAWSGTIGFKMVEDQGAYRIKEVVYDPAPSWKVKLQMALQAGDLASTLIALSAGAVEANPLMAALGPAGFVAVKLGIMAYLWHQKHRMPDKGTDIANGAYTAVVASNLGFLLR